jgi:hypothetical protein
MGTGRVAERAKTRPNRPVPSPTCGSVEGDQNLLATWFASHRRKFDVERVAQ